MRGRNLTPVRTVVLSYAPDPLLLRALFDVRSAVNQLVPDWRAHPEESRFDSTKRSYRDLRQRYGHLASCWAVTMANETSATLSAWDKLLRRAKRHDPAKFARIRDVVPRRRLLKASLFRGLYRLDGTTLDITLTPQQHVRVDLSGTRNPLFWKYLHASGGEFGLAVTDRKLIFNFRVPHPQPVAPHSVGVDLNLPTVDYATSDGLSGSVSLREITRIQGAMGRKRRSVQAALPTDLKAQRAVLRRYHRRERNRVRPLLHRAANEFLEAAGGRNVIFEDLSETTVQCLRQTSDSAQRRRLSGWTHGEFQRIVSYKSPSAVVRVNPRGSSSTCPRCGGPLAHPTWRRADCGACQGAWHRDRGAAIVLLDRGLGVLRGAAPPPSARTALLEAAAWRPEEDPRSPPSPAHAPEKGDDANFERGLPSLLKEEYQSSAR